jgi:glycopeptide antibiotics resistance protein
MIELIANNSSTDILISIIYSVLGNFFAFVPLSLYLAFRTNKKSRDLLILFAAGIGAEVIQLILVYVTRNASRVADIDDIILNLSGGLVAYFVSTRLFNRISESNRQSDKNTKFPS